MFPAIHSNGLFISAVKLKKFSKMIINDNDNDNNDKDDDLDENN